MPALGRGVLENVPPSFLKLNLSPPALGGAEIPATISAAQQPAPAQGPGIGAEVINSAARRCGGSRREGGNPGSHGPFRWVGRSQWGAEGRLAGGLRSERPQRFPGRRVFRGKRRQPEEGGRRGRGGRPAQADAPLSARLPTFQNRPPAPLTRDPARAEPGFLSARSPLLQALQASSSSAAALRRTWPSQPSLRLAVPNQPQVSMLPRKVNSQPGLRSSS